MSRTLVIFDIYWIRLISAPVNAFNTRVLIYFETKQEIDFKWFQIAPHSVILCG